ncbi:MAG: hypothetical protein NTZ59_12720 [Bacteroidetes bacterium]|nr:hypothetical protein [Bacteroidota bacterium]
MDILDDDIIKLWKTLNSNNVHYIMVGGFATTIYGGSRITQDVDVWIKDSVENRKQLRLSLNKLGYGDFEELETTQLIAGFSSIYLGSGIELDLMTSLKAFNQDNFDECYSLSTKALIDNTEVPFLHINQLLQEKQTNPRPKDLQDIEELNAIIKIQSKK